MRGFPTRLGVGTAAVALVLVTTGPASGETPGPTAAQPARFAFTDVSGESFVFELTDPDRIAEARAILASGDQKIVIGLIVKDNVGYNQPWSYHLDPATIHFSELAIEVCDATIPYVEKHLDEVGDAFLPGNQWCPWSSRLTHEVPATRAG